MALALAEKPRDILVIDVKDAKHTGAREQPGSIGYDSFVARDDQNHQWRMPADEWESVFLNYTSGNPKGVVYHHHGAAINALSNVLEWDMPKHPVYLWTLPMFHCNGRGFPMGHCCKSGR